jgi:uncharacterized protein YcbK (DUF882 family)
LGVRIYRPLVQAFRAAAQRLVFGLALVLCTASVWSASVSEAAAENRSLKLYFIHTGEKAVITYKRNGRFDPKGLAQINTFLRDWRKNEPTKMDPRLFDLVWEVYRRSGATDYIHVVSAYRSPSTNGMLRGRSRNTGVAKNSQHMLGKAMDFYIPGVKLATLRALAMQMQVGGVGFYPTSGSPFVHLDVGGVRAWPRMSRQELVRIFPKGNTLHLPSDGQPLPGYEQALADYKKRVGASSIEIASTAGGAPAAARKRTGFLAALFGGGADEEEDNSESSTPTMVSPRQQPVTPAAPARQPADAEESAPVAPPVMVAAVQPQAQPEDTITAPIPASRPAFRQDGPGNLATALYSQQRNPAQDALALQAAAAATVSPASAEFADLSRYAVPVPTLLGPRGLKGDADTSTMTASLGAAPLAMEQLASVPVPSHRPAATQLATMATPAPVPQEQPLTPELVAALSRTVADERAAQPVATVTPTVNPARVAAPARSAQPVVPPHQPVYVAALPKAATRTAYASQQFGDGFDAPKTAASASATAKKGGRAAGAASGGLTEDALAKWALDKNRAEDVASIKAPRVVTRTLSGTSTTGYAGNGFKPVAATVAIDPNRFSGQN